MKNRVINCMVALTTIIFFTTSCQYETIDLGKCSDVSFVNDLQPIFDTKCISCHGSSGGIAGVNLSEGNSYAFLTASELLDMDTPENSKL